MSRTIFGLLPSADAVEAVLDRVRLAEVPQADVSLLFLAPANEAPARRGSSAQDVQLPGIGALRTSGPLRQTLESRFPGASLGAGLQRAGVPEPHASHFELAVRDGAVLIGVRAVDEGRLSRVREAIEEHEGARSVSVRTRRAPTATPTRLPRAV